MTFEMPSRLVVVALGLAVFGCSEPTGSTLLVELRTDLLPGIEFASVRTSLENPAQQADRSVVRGEDFSEPIRVAELTDVPTGDRVLVLRLVDIDGVEVATRRARLTVSGDVGVTLAITRSCAGFACGAAETCSGGSCVSEACIEGVSGDLCEPECVADSDCTAMASCAESRCETGLCLYRQRPGACGADEYCDVAGGCVVVPDVDAGQLDSGPMDSSAMDSGVADSALDGGDSGSVFACGAAPDPGTLALYRMDDFSEGRAIDETGRHHGSFPGGVPDEAGALPMCGSAYGGRPEAYVLVPPNPDFQVAEGSLDFWWRVPSAEANATALLSRDASGSAQPGHLSLFHSGGSGRLAVRIQDRLTESHRCSDGPVVVGWHHVGINFGPAGFALYVDGIEQRGTGTWRFDSFLPDEPCELDEVTYGLDGNDNPWVIGASSANSTEGTADRVSLSHLGQLDEVRLSSVRRDFTVLAP